MTPSTQPTIAGPGAKPSKKETARIQLPGKDDKSAPKAAVRMQSTHSSVMSAPATGSSVIQRVPVMPIEPEKPDTAAILLSVAALVASLFAFGFQLVVYMSFS